MAADAAAACDSDSLVLDNWEDIEESGLLDRNLAQADSSPEEPEIMSTGPSRGMILMPTRRPQAVKILQRPSRAAAAEDTTTTANRPVPKTLKQREQEYAEARLRILGAAQSPEETDAANTTTVTSQRVSKIAGKLDAMRPGEAGLIRLPRGPDGTRGFKLRR